MAPAVRCFISQSCSTRSPCVDLVLPPSCVGVGAGAGAGAGIVMVLVPVLCRSYLVYLSIWCFACLVPVSVPVSVLASVLCLCRCCAGAGAGAGVALVGNALDPWPSSLSHKFKALTAVVTGVTVVTGGTPESCRQSPRARGRAPQPQREPAWQHPCQDTGLSSAQTCSAPAAHAKKLVALP